MHYISAELYFNIAMNAPCSLASKFKRVCCVLKTWSKIATQLNDNVNVVCSKSCLLIKKITAFNKCNINHLFFSKKAMQHLFFSDFAHFFKCAKLRTESFRHPFEKCTITWNLSKLDSSVNRTATSRLLIGDWKNFYLTTQSFTCDYLLKII